MPETAQEEKEIALRSLEERKRKNKIIKRADMRCASSLKSYYCEGCEAKMVLPKEHTQPAPCFCADCQPLVDRGWLK
jgi:hypothetical protein